MARLVIDTTGVALNTDELVPEGRYLSEISNVEEVEVKPGGENAGKPMYRVTCKIMDGPQKGRVATRSVLLFAVKGTLISYQQLAAAVGKPVTQKALESGAVEVLTESELIGQNVDIQIVHKTYQDRPVYELSRFYPPRNGVASSGAGGTAKATGKRVSL